MSRAEKLVSKVLGKFTSILRELQIAIDRCIAEREKVVHEISHLRERELDLKKAMGDAENARRGIEKLLNGGE